MFAEWTAHGILKLTQEFLTHDGWPNRILYFVRLIKDRQALLKASVDSAGHCPTIQTPKHRRPWKNALADFTQADKDGLACGPSYHLLQAFFKTQRKRICPGIRW